MANDRTTIVIDADASGVSSAVSKAEQSLGKLGGSVDNQSQKLNRYGERLGRAFGPGEGLHGRLDSLEMPLRDIEGSFDRTTQAARIFQSSAESASEKATAGFLLAADAIATFTSGGVAGIAIAAAVAGFALLSKAINEEAEEARKAEEATKKQAEALQNLAQQANAANVTISLLNSQTREKEVRERARFVEAERLAVGKRHNALIDQLRAHEEAKLKASRVAQLKGAMAAIERTKKAIEIERAAFDKLDAEHKKSNESIRKARADVEREMTANSENEITRLIDSLEKKVQAGKNAIRQATASAGQAVTEDEIMSRYAAESKAAEEANQALRKEDEAFEERQRQKQEAARQRFLENQQLQREETIAAWDAADAKKKADEEAARSAEQAAAKRMAAFREAHAVEIAALTATIGALQQMAHDGEVSFARLADAAATAAGRQLVASGTKHLLEGAAKALAGIASGDPIKVSAGSAESAKGGAMIAAGLALGAVGGAIGRSGGAASVPSSAPTDTRESRSAASSGDSGGGKTIVNFNGPAYDRRGVSQVINSGMKMARHRRIAGA